MKIVITNPVVARAAPELFPGETQRFGRGVGGVGRLPELANVSRIHGLITVTDDGFTVESTGRYTGFVVADRVTPSRLYIPCGLGPIDVPFGDCSIIIDSSAGRAYINVVVCNSDRAARWSAQWGPEVENLGWRPPDQMHMVATLQFAGRAKRVPWKKSNGKPFSWFQTLVALCEPMFTVGAAGTPSNGELAQRLSYTEPTIEHHLHEIFEALELPALDRRRRDLAATLAVSRAIVTRQDVERLPPG